MAILFDAAYPNSGDPNVDGHLAYVGGDTPHDWTDAEIAAAPGRYLLPTFVRSNPSQCDPHVDAQAFITWLLQHNAPAGTATVLDLETAVAVSYVNAFGGYLHAVGFKVLPYGSKSTLFQNPALDGYFVSDPTGTDHIVAGSVATQYKFDQTYDLDDITTAVKLWDTAAPANADAISQPTGAVPMAAEFVLETTDTKNAWLVYKIVDKLQKAWIPDPSALAAFQKLYVTVQSHADYASGIPTVGVGPTQ